MISHDPPDASEQAYRTYLRSLASLLVPPSSPTLSSLLTSATSSLSHSFCTPLEWGQQEKSVDFWDEPGRRKGFDAWENAAGAGGGGGEKWERWEVTREQVEELKRRKREWMEKQEREEEDGEEERFELASWFLPPRLSDEFLLPRRSRLSTISAGSSSLSFSTINPTDMCSLLSPLNGPPPTCLLPKPDDAMKKMDEMPEVEEALDIKLALPPAALTFIKQERSRFVEEKKVDIAQSLRVEKEEDWAELGEFPCEAPLRLGSPPLFPRHSFLAITPSSHHSAALNDPLRTIVGQAYLTSSSDLNDAPPSSPRGRGVGMGEWNKEEGISSSVPVSPRTVLEEVKRREVKVWSSDGPERRLMGQEGEGEGGFELVDSSALLSLAAEDATDTDQLASNSDSDTERDLDRVHELTVNSQQGKEKKLEDVFASDETMGSGVPEEVREGEVVCAARLMIPHLPPPLSSLPSPLLPPPLSAFACPPASLSSTPASTFAPSRSSLPVPRSLTLSLSWDPVAPLAAVSAENATSLREDVFEEGEENGGKEVEEELRREGREVRRVVMEAFGREDEEKWEKEGERGEEWPIREQEDEEEELMPRRPDVSIDVEEDDEEQLEEHGVAMEEEDAPAFSPRTPSSPLPSALPSPLPTFVHPSPISHYPPSPATAAPPVQPHLPPPPVSTSQAPSHPPVDQVADSSSSNFEFIFPPTSPSLVEDERSAEKAVSVEQVEEDDEPAFLADEPTRPSEPTLDDLVDHGKIARSAFPPAPSFSPSQASTGAASRSAALDRFLALRGRADKLPPAQPRLLPPSRSIPAQPSQHPPEPLRSSPPPDSIPFTLPPFLASSPSSPSSASLPFPLPSSPSSSSSPIRILASTAFLQLRAHYTALQREGFEVVHRERLLPPARLDEGGGEGEGEEEGESHLLLDPLTAVVFLPLVELIGEESRVAREAQKREAEEAGLVWDDGGERGKKKKASVFSRLRKLAREFDRVLLVLEEPTRGGGGGKGRKPYAYTPPVLSGLQSLANSLSSPSSAAAEGSWTEGVQLALSKGPEEEEGSGGLVRKFAEWVARVEEKEEVKEGWTRGEGGGRREVRVWEDGGRKREWLRDDPTEDELSLLTFFPASTSVAGSSSSSSSSPAIVGLNAFAAALIIGTCGSLDALVRMTEGERGRVFGRALGRERVNRLSTYISSTVLSLPPPTPLPPRSHKNELVGSSDSCLASAPSHFVSLSQIGGNNDEEEGEEEGGEGAGGSGSASTGTRLFDEAFDWEAYEAQGGRRY
ncbi:hypothetical protein JCM8547_001987 [Rhodosporidiobolus lusitaniae]